MNADMVLRADAGAYRLVNHLASRTPWAHKPMAAFATGGAGLFALLALPAWHRARMQPNASRAVAATVWAAGSTLLAIGSNRAMIPAIGRRRPFREMLGATVLVTDVRNFSFPSNHAMTAGAATTGLWIAAFHGDGKMRSMAVASSMLAVSLGFSRVYVGVHYPGDVLGGMIVGSAGTLLGWLLVGPRLTHLAQQAAQHPTLGRFIDKGGDTDKARETGASLPDVIVTLDAPIRAFERDSPGSERECVASRDE